MTAIIKSGRDAWLAERKTAVGASEVAAILGEDKRRGALAIYAEKVADKPSETDEEWLAWGRDVEGAIVKGYARKTGREVLELSPFDFVRCPGMPFFGATLDRRLAGGSEAFPAPAAGVGALEAKAVGFHKMHEWTSDPPLVFVIQVQAQMACTELLWGSLAAIFGGVQIAEPVDILPDLEFVESMKEAIAEFWWHVENKVPPEADAKPATKEALRRLWARDLGKTIALDHDALLIVDEWEKRNAERHHADDQYTEQVNRIALLMQDAAVGILPDGSSLQYRTEDVSAQCCKGCGAQVKKEFTRRTPKRIWPKALKKKGK